MPLRLSAQGADKDEALAGLMDNSRVSPGLGSAVAVGSGQRMGMWEGRALEPLGVHPSARGARPPPWGGAVFRCESAFLTVD